MAADLPSDALFDDPDLEAELQALQREHPSRWVWGALRALKRYQQREAQLKEFARAAREEFREALDGVEGREQFLREQLRDHLDRLGGEPIVVPGVGRIHLSTVSAHWSVTDEDALLASLTEEERELVAVTHETVRRNRATWGLLDDVLEEGRAIHGAERLPARMTLVFTPDA